MFEQYAADYTAYMNLMQGLYGVIVAVVVAVGVIALGALLIAYIPRNDQLKAKDEIIRQLRQQATQQSQARAEDQYDRAQLVAEMEDKEMKARDQKIKGEEALNSRYQKEILTIRGEYLMKLNAAREERDNWRHKANLAERRAKLYAQLADRNGKDGPALRSALNEVENEIRTLDKQIRKSTMTQAQEG